MKNLLTLFLMLSLASTKTDAQVSLLYEEEYTVEANINLAKDQLTEIVSKNAVNLELSNGELMIHFPLKENVRQEFYKVDLEISIDGEALSLMEENLDGDFGDHVISKKNETQKITWMQLVDSYQQLNGQLLIKIKAELWGKPLVLVDCNKPPTFTFKQQMPYAIAGGVGLLAIGAGQYFKIKSRDTYDDEYLNAQNLEEAIPLYDNANSDHHAYLVLSYAGSAVLVADAVWYLIRKGKYKKQLRIYEKFCNKISLSVEPMIELPIDPNGDSATGLRLSFNF